MANANSKESNGRAISRQNVVGLNAANFFLAEITGVVMPFLVALLKQQKWGESAIGVTLAVAGLGVFLCQTPAGCIVDRVQSRRVLLAGASLVLGVCYGLVPLVPTTPAWIDPLLFTAGGAQAFFVPLLGALALGLVGHGRLNRRWGVINHGTMREISHQRCWRLELSDGSASLRFFTRSRLSRFSQLGASS